MIKPYGNERGQALTSDNTKVRDENLNWLSHFVIRVGTKESNLHLRWSRCYYFEFIIVTI